MALPEVKKEDKVSTRKIAERSDLSVVAPALNKLFDTIRNNDQKENRFLTKHIDGESSEYTLIQDNNINMLNILSSQSITESLLGTMRDTVSAGTTSGATMVSSPRVLQQTRQEPRQNSSERPRERQRVVPSASVMSTGSIDNRSVPRVVSESVKKIDSYVSNQSGQTKFSELKTINEETGEALERSASLLSNINESVQRQNRLLEETIENLKRQLEETDDNLPDINIDLDRRRNRGRGRGDRSGQRPSTGSRPQARGSAPRVTPSVTPETLRSQTPLQTSRSSATPSRPNVVGGIVGGLIAGAAAEGATSYLTGKDEGLSAALLGLSPVATGVVGAAAGIKGTFELAENLTPEERKGAIDPLKKAELAVADKIKIKFIKDIEPFKAGQVVDASDITQKFEVVDDEKVEFIKQLFDTKQVDVASEAPVSTPRANDIEDKKLESEDAEPLDKDLLSPVSQSYMEKDTDTGWQEADAEGDTGWQEAEDTPSPRSIPVRSVRTRRREVGDVSDSLTITAQEVVFKSDKMEAPFLDAIKEELSDFMNTIMNVSNSPVSPNLSGGGLASPVSFANISGGMTSSTPSFGSAPSGTPTPGSGAVQGGESASGDMSSTEKPGNVTVDSGVDVSKVDKDLMGRFYAAAKEYGKPVKINSGFRSDEKQAELWVRANVFKEPGIYMPAKPDKPTTINYRGQTFNVPGGGAKSSHGGSSPNARALDITRTAIEEMDRMGLLKKYGLHRPFPNDPVHVEKMGGSSTPPDTSTDGAQQAASQISASPATTMASSEGGQQVESGGETATPVASEASGGEAMASGASGAAESGASMTPSTPSSGPTVATASVENEVAKRTPMAPSAPTPETPSSGSSSPGVGDTSYPISMGDPGNVEPPDAAQRYALLFDMAA